MVESREELGERLRREMLDIFTKQAREAMDALLRVYLTPNLMDQALWNHACGRSH
jgi:hypothetical protein